MHPTTAGPGSPGPANPSFTTEEIAAALRAVELPGPGPLIVTLIDEQGFVVAIPEVQDVETWQTYGAEVVLNATALGLRGLAGALEGVTGYALILPAYGIAYAVDRTDARHTIALPGPHTTCTPDRGVAEPVFRGLAAMIETVTVPGPPPAAATRPVRMLMIGGDEALRAQLAALAPPGELFLADAGSRALRYWATASLVLVCHDALKDFAPQPEPVQRPPLLIVLAPTGADPWQDAVRIGATHVVFWPTCRDWLAAHLQDPPQPGLA